MYQTRMCGQGIFRCGSEIPKIGWHHPLRWDRCRKAILETTLEDWETLIRVNLTGTFLCAQAAAKIMVKQRYGRILLMGSAAGERGGTGRTASGQSKGGVSAMTRVFSVELAELGITVNALAPGAIETELVAKMHGVKTRTSYCSRIPANRYRSPD